MSENQEIRYWASVIDPRWTVPRGYAPALVARGYCQGKLLAYTGDQVCDTRRMNEQAPGPSYKRYRFAPEVIAHAVWLYFRFALSYRDGMRQNWGDDRGHGVLGVA